MGQGAHVTIVNNTQEAYTVSYPSGDMSCLYTDGTDGSDLTPITGEIGPGTQLPANAGEQYIEAISHGTCKFESTTLGMLFVDGAMNSALVQFAEKGWAWGVAQSSYPIGNNTIEVNVTDNGEGNTDVISVTVVSG